MGGVMSGDGERDFDLCLRVNLYGTLALLERTRQLTQQYYHHYHHTDTNDDSADNNNKNDNNDQSPPTPVYQLTALPKFIFCSAGAIIGAGSPTDYIQCDDVISDQCRSTPHSTYGMTKSCCELLLSDYTRRNFCDGRAVRLPTIVVRAGLPNAATTSCYSSIIREPLAGRDLVAIPISHDVTHAVTSTRAAIRAILQLYTVPKDRVDAVCGYDRTIFIPATSVTLHELYTTLLQKVIHVDSHPLLGHIDYSVESNISNMVASFPHQINPARATQLDISPSPSIETMIREYIEDFPSALVPNLQIVPPAMINESITPSRTTTTTTIHTPIMIGATLPKRIAIITGAGSGIGRAVAQRLVQSQKWMVILTGRTISTLRETQQLCGADGETTITQPQSDKHPQPLSIQNHCLCIPTDVTIEADVIRLFDMVKEQFGRVDLLFNNAGVNSTAASIEQVTLPDFERVLATNVTGPFLCAREATKIMSQQDPPGGRIINNGSLSSQVPRPHSTTYTTSKHALSGLTKCIALDGRKYNVACGQVDFGNIVTELSLNTNRPNVGALQANGSTTLVEPSMNVQDAAETIYTMANLPLDANILQMTVMATTMPFVGRG